MFDGCEEWPERMGSLNLQERKNQTAVESLLRGVGSLPSSLFPFRNGYSAARQAGRSVEAAVLRSAITHHEDDARTPAGIPSLVELFLRWLFN